MATDMFYDLEIEVEVGQPSLSVSFDITKSDVDLTTEEIAILRGPGPDLDDYVKKEQTIAGITLENNISTEQLLEALNVQYGAQENLVNDFRIDDISFVSDKIAELKTINGDYNSLNNKIATENDLPKTASDIHALPDDTKYGASIEAIGTELFLKDQDGNVLSTTTTQDTTYGVATYDAMGLIKLSSNTLATQPVQQISSVTGRQYAVQLDRDNRASVNVPWTDTGAIGVGESGEGNAYTSSTYDVSTRKIIFTKGKTFLTHLDVDSALNSLSENPVQNKVLAVLIPSDASALNPLATQNFVNSSISTNTANFIGTFLNVSALNAYSGTVTNNDYAFVVNGVVTDNGNDWATFVSLDAYDKTLLTNFDYAWVINGTKFDLYRFDIVEQRWNLRIQNTDKDDVTLNNAFNRYKATAVASAITWDYEYTLNNSSFTASQWATINSGLTSADKTKLDGIEDGAEKNTVTSVNSKTGAVVLNADDISDSSTINKFVTSADKQIWDGKYEKPSGGIPKIDLSNDVQKSLNTADDVKNSKFIVKEYPSFDDFPAIKISYRYTTSFDYTWGPPEEYYTYQNGKWVTNVEGVYLDISNPPFDYTYEDLQNVTCEITSQLPTDVYPDITVNSFELSYAYGDVTPNYISAAYYPVLNTSYGDSQHNPYTNNISFSFDIILPEKVNPEISLNVLYKAVDTGKLYIPNFTTSEWEEYTGSYLDGTPLMNVIDKLKQDKLEPGKNISNINGASLLEGGNLNLATSADLSRYLLKSYVRTARSTSTIGYTYDVRYINGLIKTARTTTANSTYDCTYVNDLIKTSNTSSNDYTYSCTYVNNLIKTSTTISDTNTYSCTYMNNTFLTLETLPKWDGGNE